MCTIDEDHIWFLKCKVRQTEIFVILGHFLHFLPPDNPDNQKKNEKMKNCMEILPFYTCVP